MQKIFNSLKCEIAKKNAHQFPRLSLKALKLKSIMDCAHLDSFYLRDKVFLFLLTRITNLLMFITITPHFIITMTLFQYSTVPSHFNITVILCHCSTTLYYHCDTVKMSQFPTTLNYLCDTMPSGPLFQPILLSL